ncbi:MAG: hypothetical protein ACRDJW_20400 [Thermomicrobiales bacterium]
MDVFTLFDADAPWLQMAGVVVALVGLALFWRGLIGGPHGERGLLRPHAGALGRAEGWRLTVLGLAIAGLGAAGVWEARWLLFLSVGIGFVEVLEATMVIAAWKAGAGRTATRRA